MKHTLTLITLLLLPLTCFARLGETKEQLNARYGKPLIDEKIETQMRKVGYANNGFCFTVYLLDDKSVAMIISHFDSQPMTDHEIKSFLDKNSIGSGFNFDSLNSDMAVRIFIEIDSERSGRYYPSNPKSDNFSPRLLIATKEGLARTLDYWTKLLDDKTQGF